MYGTVPIADPDSADEVIEAIAEDFAAQAQAVDLASIFWLPVGSPWAVAVGSRLADPEWVTTNMMRYSSFYTEHRRRDRRLPRGALHGVPTDIAAPRAPVCGAGFPGLDYRSTLAEIMAATATPADLLSAAHSGARR